MAVIVSSGAGMLGSARVLESGPRGTLALAGGGKYLGMLMPWHTPRKDEEETTYVPKVNYDERTVLSAERVLAGVGTPRLTPVRFALFMKAVNRMVKSGCLFTDDQVRVLFKGKAQERFGTFGKFDGYYELADVLIVSRAAPWKSYGWKSYER